MGSQSQKGPKLPGFRGSSLAQAIQGNFDHLMATVRELMRGHNLVVDDIESLAGTGEIHTVELGQHQSTLEDHEDRIETAEGDIVYVRGQSNRKPPGVFYDQEESPVWLPPKGDKGDTGATGATGSAATPVPWPGEDGEPGFFIPGADGADGTGSGGSALDVQEDAVSVDAAVEEINFGSGFDLSTPGAGRVLVGMDLEEDSDFLAVQADIGDHIAGPGTSHQADTVGYIATNAGEIDWAGDVQGALDYLSHITRKLRNLAVPGLLSPPDENDYGMWVPPVPVRDLLNQLVNTTDTKQVWYPAYSGTVDSTGGATESQAGTLPSRRAFHLWADAVTDNGSMFNMTVPDDWHAGSAITMRLYYEGSTAFDGVATWALKYEYLHVADSADESAAGTTSAVTTITPAGTYGAGDLVIDSARALGTPAATGDFIRLYAERRGAAGAGQDTYTGNLRLFGVMLEYTADVITASGSTVATLDDLSDVVITSVADDQTLTYDGSTSKWVNVGENLVQGAYRASLLGGDRAWTWDEIFNASTAKGGDFGAVTAIASTGTATLGAEAGHPGVVTLAISTTAGSLARYGNTSDLGIQNGGGSFECHYFFKTPSVVSNATDTYRLGIGAWEHNLEIAIAATHVGGRITYTHGTNGGRWQSETGNAAATGESKDTGLAMNVDTWIHLVVVFTPTQVDFYMGEAGATPTLRTSHTNATHIPDASHPFAIGGFAIGRTAGTTNARSFKADAMGVNFLDFTTDR